MPSVLSSPRNSRSHRRPWMELVDRSSFAKLHPLSNLYTQIWKGKEGYVYWL
ncbi:unnamed protein product [Arabidopsis halleri]